MRLPFRHVDPIQSDLAACRDLLRRGSRSFTTASYLLPKRVRDPATTVYAFCRIADDAIDHPEAGTAALARLRQRLAKVYSGQPEGHPADRALARVVSEHGIPASALEWLLEGFEWDLTGRRYETLEDLLAYCVRVAGTVGMVMALLMRRRDHETLARACDLGVAMQLTNIARDVGEDADAGRVYLPLQWLRHSGVDPDAFLADPVFSAEVGAVVARLLRSADEYYALADVGIARLPLDCRPGIRAARLIYAAIGNRIRANGFDSVDHRAVVTGRQKLRLASRALRPTPWALRRDDGSPAIEAAQPLLATISL